MNETAATPATAGPETSIKPQLAAAAGSALAERLKLTLNYDELTNCMRCGFCQPACPTFKETGLEAASPRGRIALMKAVVDGIMPADESFQAQMDLCLGCRACEPVCPADVKYGQLLEHTRAGIEQHREHRRWVKAARSLAFRRVFPRQSRVRLLGRGLKLYQRSGLQTLARKSGVMKLFPEHMRQMERILPDAESRGVAEQLGTFYPAKGKAIARVGMFRGCIMDILFTETNVRTVKLLSQAGFDVVIPPAQNCCGALHAHSGALEEAKELACRNIRTFMDEGVDYVVSNAGGCGALLVEYGHLLHDSAEYAEAAAQFAASVKDVSELLLQNGRLPEFAAKPVEAEAQPMADAAKDGAYTTVTYQDSCHLRNVMKASNAPRNLIGRVGNVRFNELQGADRCCGSAGIYNLVQPDMSFQILDHKMEHVKQTNAHHLLTSNPGCLLQMKAGIEREGLSDRMQAEHIVDFLYERLVEKE